MRTGLLAGIAVAISTTTHAQSIYIDVHDAFGTPSSSFGAAANIPGVWNPVPATVGTSPLVDTAGNATTVTITAAGMAAALASDNAGTTGDDQALMDDISNPSPGGATWTISGLVPGDYDVATYAWAPDNVVFVSLVSVAGSSDPAQTVGGAWPGGYQLGVTHALHEVFVTTGGAIAVTITAAGGGSFGSVNGFQVVPHLGGIIGNCFPGTAGVIPCPCGQPANSNGGCANFGAGATSGAVLNASGLASLAADTVVLLTTNQRAGSPITNVFWTGSGALTNGVAHGAGVRCAAAALKRLYTGQTTNGALLKPGAGDPSVSARSAALGVPISPGEVRHYFNIYRDNQAAGPCGNTASTVNTTNGFSILWSP